MLATLTFKPLHKTPPKNSRSKTNIASQLINVDNWKNKKYVVWAFAIPSALFGYFVPYVHIVSQQI
jgi:MCP family monocarboxylic acid transporter-like MFS transporter 10